MHKDPAWQDTEERSAVRKGPWRNPATGFPGQLCLGSGMPSESEF